MDTLVDIFSGDAFSVRTLTDAINLVPIQYGRVNQLGLFQEKGVNTTMVMIESLNGVLNLIPSSARGTAAPKNKTGKRVAKPASILRFALDDQILPEDIQNVREFASTNLQTVSSVVNDRLVDLSRKHDITNEWLKVGALQGKVFDADGSTLFNSFTLMGGAETVVDFALDDDATDVAAKCREVTGNIEDFLLNDTMNGVRALWAPDAFAAFIGQATVKAAYANYQNMVNVTAGYAPDTANPLRDDVRKGFVFAGITHEEYRGKATDAAGNVRKFIPDGTVRFFPTGTGNLFKHYNAPADWTETVNTTGLSRYAKVLPDLGGRWVDILTMACPLPICLQPKVLVKGTM